MIVFRSPKGWTGPKEVDGQRCEGYWRSHQVPLSDMSKPGHVRFHLVMDVIDRLTKGQKGLSKVTCG